MTSRKASKERTRGRLVQATLKILQQKGPGALTTGRIAEAAGVAQPTFYVHFDGMDRALDIAASGVADSLLLRLQDSLEGVREAGAEGVLRSVLRGTVEAFVSDRRAATLILRHRRDVATPLGKRWSKLIEQVRDEMLASLGEANVFDSVADRSLFSELLMGTTLMLVEGALDGRLSDADVDATIDAFVRTLPRVSRREEASRTVAA